MSESLDDLGDYLIFATNAKVEAWYIFVEPNDNIKPIKKENVSKEILTFLQYRACVDPNETLFARQRKTPNGLTLTGACPRGGGLTICGCNGKTYGSPCESHKDGVMKYSAGPCPK
jgi:hypothetical protein